LALLLLFSFYSSAAYSVSLDNSSENYDIESPYVSLSDTEDVMYEAYLEEYAEELAVSSEQLEEDTVALLKSAQDGSLDLELLNKVGALEVAVNPLKESFYAEVDFMAHAMAQEYKDRFGESLRAFV
ncbi:MAG: hypothetical protein OXC40_02445, partial [Proteobacteria bacterium]|nr:hypothetical protein [Pseudomonadota bacterium]